MTFIILAMFGLLAGLGASLFGFGGGFVIVPLLYHLLGSADPQTMRIAAATSTSVMIVSAIFASLKHHWKGNIRWDLVFPLAIYIALGAAMGVWLSPLFSNDWLRCLFVAYLVYTIADCVFGKNFIRLESPDDEMRRISAPLEVFLGLTIGAVSTLLGVGGSVMTVPLMRRLGAKMTEAVAVANPLSVPVAFVGVVGYTLLSFSQHTKLGQQYVGFIYLPAFILLTIGALVGVSFGARFVHIIPARVHAHIYVLLLCMVTLSMLFK